jgi:hypothetical protein
MNYKVFGVAFENFSSHPQFLFSHIKLRETFPEVFFKAKKVNHHNQTIVFAIGLVSNVWLLEQFLEVMGGMAPMFSYNG